MKNNNVLIGILVIALAFAGGIIVSGPLHRLLDRGGPEFGPPGGPGGRHILRYLERDLDLSTEQIRRIKNIVEKNTKKEEEYREKIHAVFDAQKNLLEAESFNENAVRAAIRSLNPVEEELKVLHIKQIYEIEGVLSPEQLKKFRELKRKEMKRLRKGGPPEGHPPGPGGDREPGPPDHPPGLFIP
ncbi:MAG TPA: Spy/CpxP family protein refolding chaperone [Spirochaetota bacterium]|nr:Spy/CpxP family protein refolding chaperone [Spirochaetota bacterium]HPI90722.1 Spy/CpxP family protein refolding chaperone [Spirochaetota bacterium]HPR49743.1 Spy/CpxP family protein refolding chaperone [Spirochaetota bacterium]